MAYNKPAVQVYQDLVNAGGAAELNPDMPACIVGPLQTVIDVDLADSISKIDSIGSSSATSQEAATYATTPANGSETFINFTSAKPGQVLDTSTIQVTAENPLVKTFSFEATSAASAGAAIAIEANTVGNISAVGNTPLPFANTINHISLGDTVMVGPIGSEVATYISAVDYSAGTITLNNATLAVSIGDIVTVYHKFDSIAVGSVDISETTGAIAYDDVSFLEASSDTLLAGYTMFPEAEIEGTGDSLSLYVGYRANRSDLSGRVLTISSVTDLGDQLGEISSSNPLAYGVSLALANSGGAAINAIAIDPRLSERDAHIQATELAQGQRMYALVPLTQELSIHAIYKAHVNAMSLPTSGNWRVALTNCSIPEEDYLYGKPGSADGDDADNIPDLLEKVSIDGVNIDLGRGASAPLVFPGDYLQAIVLNTDGEPTDEYIQSDSITANSGSTIVLNSTTWVDANGDTVSSPAAGDLYVYVARPATKQGQAEWVASQAETWNDKRLWMFPGDITIPNESGLDEVLPGYYLMAAQAGFISGTPPQQPITHITVAGITDMLHGNFYFTEAQMNLMAEKGALLYEQNSQGTTPYCRHGLTTDVSVLEYREVLKVKNWDYLSYYYKDLLDPFIGTWNITSDTIQTIRQTAISASESLLTRKLPKIGAPLLSYNITKLEQNATSADAIDFIMGVAIVNPNNYTNVHLQL